MGEPPPAAGTERALGSVRYRIRHVTRYRYGAPVASSHVLVHLEPRDTLTQSVESATIASDPTPGWSAAGLDEFGNHAHHLELSQPHDHLQVESTSVVAVRPFPWLHDTSSPPWEAVAAAVRADRTPDGLLARQCALPSPCAAPSDATRAFAAPSFEPGRPVLDAVVDLAGRIHQGFAFDPTASDVSTPVDEVLARRRGVCQDFAHVLLACLRGVGLPGRYVSGYLETLPPPGWPRLVGADASHAWVAVHVPGLGWFDVDPTNDQHPPERHVTVAWGRDYGDVTPVRGVVFGPETDQDLAVSVDVERLDDAPAAGGPPTGSAAPLVN